MDAKALDMLSSLSADMDNKIEELWFNVGTVGRNVPILSIVFGRPGQTLSEYYERHPTNALNHGEGGLYKVSEAEAASDNQVQQGRYEASARNAFLKIPTRFGSITESERIKPQARHTVLSILGDALHVAQDRGAHREGAIGLGHDNPKVDPDSPTENTEGYVEAQRNTELVLLKASDILLRLFHQHYVTRHTARGPAEVEIIQRSPDTTAILAPHVAQGERLTSEPTDRDEQQACQMAELIMGIPNPNVVKRHSDFGDVQLSTVPPVVHEVLRSPGQPLDDETRIFFEARIGLDFARVRVHTDEKAGEPARAVSALAYTVGRDILFDAGRYALGTTEGRQLLAHDLTHIIQQGSQTQFSTTKSETTTPLDIGGQQAEMAAKAIGEGQSFAPAPEGAVQVARQVDAGAHATAAPASAGREITKDAGTCTPSTPGIPPTLANCSVYLANNWWLPMAYANNATCACLTTPNSQTANCVRKFLQERLAATPRWVKAAAAVQKPLEMNPVTYPSYQVFVQSVLTPRIYQDHVDAYRNCCCPSGPAPYLSWMGVTTVPIQPCSLVGDAIKHFGSCHGTPGRW